jgi:hypothetical protein
MLEMTITRDPDQCWSKCDGHQLDHVLGLRHYDSFYPYDRSVMGLTSRLAKML